MYVVENRVPVFEGLRGSGAPVGEGYDFSRPQRQTVRARSLLRGFGVQASPGKAPFYAHPYPVASFLKALQKTLSIPVTGTWDQRTHEALGSWFLAWEAENEEGGATVVPAWGEVKKPEIAADVAKGFAEALDIYGEVTPAFLSALGFASREAASEDGGWQAAKADFTAALLAHIAEKELEAAWPSPPPSDAGPPPSDEGPPPSDAGPPPATVLSGRRGWMIAGGIALGVVIVGIAIAALRRRKDASAGELGCACGELPPGA